MTDSYPEPGYFEGTSPKECEILVATIRRRALEQGKQRDSEWMALLASSYLIGDALYWYEGLDEGIQNDWSQLRPALLARFGRSGPPQTASSSASVIPVSSPPTTIPTPAAAPPITNFPLLVRRGRLKVLSPDGTLRGYFAKPDLADGVLRTGPTSSENALLISLSTSPSGEAFEIQTIHDPGDPGPSDYLAICWISLNESIWQYSDKWFASGCSFSIVAASKRWAVQKKVWKFSNNGDLDVDYPKQGGGSQKLLPFLLKPSVTIRWLKPSRPSTDGYDPIRLVFEDAK